MSLNDSTTRTIRIVSGSSTVSFSDGNTFTLKLPQSGFQTGKDEISLKSLTIYNSWFNISQEKGNNQFSYIWPGAGSFPVVIADGIWDFSDIMNYFKQVMKKNGHYLIDSTGLEHFYLDLVVNPVLYCLSFTATPLPTALPEDWQNPSGITLGDGLTPQMTIPATFSRLTGFAPGNYPADPATTLFQVNSGVPQITDVTTLNLSCNLLDKTGFSFGPGVLASFVQPEGTRPGSLISIEPTNLDWVPVQQQQIFQEVSISLVDQLMRPVTIHDPTGMVAILNVRRRRN